mgnify:CR=1 FL=1
MEIDLEDNEKEFIELKVKKEVGANGMRSWKLGMVGEKAIRKTIDETIIKLNEKLK